MSNINKDIDIDIKLLSQFLSCQECEVIEKNNLTPYDNGEKIFPWTNEVLKFCYKKNLIGKRVISVNSGADHILHAALAGATYITGFDINRFCKHYCALKIAMIRTYGHDKFFDKFELLLQLICNYYSRYHFSSNGENLKRILDEVSKYLNDDVIKFWQFYINIVNEIPVVPPLANSMMGSSCKDLNAWSNKINYNLLKYNLGNCKINYIDAGVEHLSEKLSDTFDLMYLSNIFDVIACWNNNTIEKQEELLIDFSKFMNPGGVIYDYDSDEIDYRKSDAITKYYDIKEKQIYHPCSINTNSCDIVHIFKRK